MKPSSMVPFTKPMAAIVRLLIFAARTIPATWADQRPAHEAPREPEGPQRSAGLEAARLFESEAAARSQRSRRGHNRAADGYAGAARSEEHTSELESLLRISYAVFCLKKKKSVKKHTEVANMEICILKITNIITCAMLRLNTTL